MPNSAVNGTPWGVEAPYLAASTGSRITLREDFSAISLRGLERGQGQETGSEEKERKGVRGEKSAEERKRRAGFTRQEWPSATEFSSAYPLALPTQGSLPSALATAFLISSPRMPRATILP